LRESKRVWREFEAREELGERGAWRSLRSLQGEIGAWDWRPKK